ncbi:MAG: SDR family oxidoreductase [Pseudomonadota bacterium]|nr:SDR family oxidoreductase [Pseudomonadota bacterium]
MPALDLTDAPISQLISLRGRTAVVTGGARGIGLAIARRLSEAGANLVIADKDEAAWRDALEHLATRENDIIGVTCDAREEGSIERAAEEADGRFGRLDIWVNDAGIYPSTPVMEISKDEWENVIHTNVRGVFNGARAAIPRMTNNGGGVILNLASVTGFHGSPGFAHYSASKFAVRGLTATLAKEMAKDNIRVLALAPTLIKTPGVEKNKPDMDKMAHGDVIKQHAKEIPLGRVGVPDDIARVALFAVSDLAAFMTGTTIVIDGGALAMG